MKNLLLLLLILCSPLVKGNTPMNRGMIAIHQGNGVVNVSWRLFAADSEGVTFDLYRSTNKQEAIKLNDSPLSKSTYFVDKGVDTSLDQYYILYARSGKEREAVKIASYLLTPELASVPYLSIPLEPLPFDTAHVFQPNDASVGDLDGDGELEIVIKRMGAFYACSQKGVSPHSMVLEAYKLNGQRLWQIDLGVNIRQGAQYFQFLVYDFDGDGCAEVAIKSSEGTRFGDGRVIGDTDGDGITDYVIRDPSLRTYGKILSGPEFFSVVDGKTGKELARGPYIERGRSEDWGDDYGNRVDRQLGAVGYFDGKHPGIFWGRGYNGRSAMQAWNFRDGKLVHLWSFDTADSPEFKDYEDQGNHNIRVADVDGDGCDEIIYGACAIDHDGAPLHTTRLGHGDAMHLTDIDPFRLGFEVWQGHEYPPAGSSLRDACTGEILFRIPSSEDVGRAMCADIDPRYPGCEVWSSHSGGLYSCKGEKISDKIPSVNMAVWWDGDLSRELLDGVRIQKWTGDGMEILFDGKDKGILSNNGTKANPCLSADILGDWREEVIWRSADNNELRIYLTPYETEHRFPTFLEDHIYMLSVVTENVGYNQPPAPGFYFGTDVTNSHE
ncbi:rhamnogalacturonan lyase [Bacteroides sp. 51]|uniref:rhamnogalacturonan lyase n=1 Tax=Bacteroides sp. 51 TaxID=2302938 RepID=UPI0013D7A684|nr:rhamnogalacturonan lyase [Bacteroides sp. 51]